MTAQIAPLPAGGNARPPELRAEARRSTETAPARIFKIGFAHSDPADPLNGNWFRALERRLNQPEFAASLAAAGFARTAALEAEGVRDLIQRLDHDEFDLAFCPSVAFIQQRGNYQTVYQLRPPGVFSSRGERVYLRSCILLGPHHPRFAQARDLTAAEIAAILEDEPAAFVSPWSASGYLYPLLMFKREYGVNRPSQYYFYQSPEAVIKALGSGLAHVGACDFAALEKMRLEAERRGIAKDRIAFVLKQSPAKIPADPIVVRAALAASRRPEVLELLQALERAIQAHFQADARTEKYALQRAGNEIYAELGAAYRELQGAPQAVNSEQ